MEHPNSKCRIAQAEYLSRLPEEERDICDGPIAMAYVPWQKWQALYEAEKGFCRGTIFAELDKPFEGTGGRLR